MTNAEEIINAVAELFKQGKKTFSREDVRYQLGVSAKPWLCQYTAIFQAMRDDHPGGAPEINTKFKDLFHRSSYGVYILTSKGKKLVKKIDC